MVEMLPKSEMLKRGWEGVRGEGIVKVFSKSELRD